MHDLETEKSEKWGLSRTASVHKSFFSQLTLINPCRSVSGNSISDHLVYFGVELMGDPSGSCKIVTDPRIMKYGTADPKGNLVLSKTPVVSVLRSGAGSSDRQSIL